MHIVNKSGFLTVLVAAVVLTACQSRSVAPQQEAPVQFIAVHRCCNVNLPVVFH